MATESQKRRLVARLEEMAASVDGLTVVTTSLESVLRVVLRLGDREREFEFEWPDGQPSSLMPSLRRLHQTFRRDLESLVEGSTPNEDWGPTSVVSLWSRVEHWARSKWPVPFPRLVDDLDDDHFGVDVALLGGRARRVVVSTDGDLTVATQRLLERLNEQYDQLVALASEEREARVSRNDDKLRFLEGEARAWADRHPDVRVVCSAPNRLDCIDVWMHRNGYHAQYFHYYWYEDTDYDYLLQGMRNRLNYRNKRWKPSRPEKKPRRKRGPDIWTVLERSSGL